MPSALFVNRTRACSTGGSSPFASSAAAMACSTFDPQSAKSLTPPRSPEGHKRPMCQGARCPRPPQTAIKVERISILPMLMFDGAPQLSHRHRGKLTAPRVSEITSVSLSNFCWLRRYLHAQTPCTHRYRPKTEIAFCILATWMPSRPACRCHKRNQSLETSCEDY